jgi:hypothetical protein
LPGRHRERTLPLDSILTGDQARLETRPHRDSHQEALKRKDDYGLRRTSELRDLIRPVAAITAGRCIVKMVQQDMAPFRNNRLPRQTGTTRINPKLQAETESALEREPAMEFRAGIVGRGEKC